nr:hypothetical protein [Aneurinibacillus sp. XH2]
MLLLSKQIKNINVLVIIRVYKELMGSEENEMAVVVLHKPSGERYLLLGTGFGAYKAARPSLFGGNLFPHEEAGEIPAAAVCDELGNIHWFYTEELQVLEIDGMEVGRLYGKLKSLSSKKASDTIPAEMELCPACRTRVKITDKECPSCGLTLIG